MALSHCNGGLGRDSGLNAPNTHPCQNQQLMVNLSIQCIICLYGLKPNVGKIVRLFLMISGGGGGMIW
jgi:hypothetical protein